MTSEHHTFPTEPSNYYWFIAFIAAFAGVLFGYDTGVISGAILFISHEFNLSPQLNGLVVSAVLIGAFLGAVFSGRLADHFGRKRLLVLDAIIFIIGTILTSVATSIFTIIIGRIIVGIAIGVSSYVAPLYISEISPPKYRGALVSLNQLAITIGILISYVVDYYFAAGGAWRSMFGLGVIPAALLLIGMFTLPDSPRWILAIGQEEQALAVLHKIRGHGPHAIKEFEEIKESLKQQKGNWRMLFSKTIRPTLVIGAGLALFQQVSGINTIIYYAPTIFNMAGFHQATTAILATMGVGVVFVIFTVIALPLIDTLGRRPLLFIGISAMSLSLIALSWAFEANSQTALLKWTAMGSMVVFIAGFAISLGPIMWLMISEVFPLKVRGLGSSIATCVNWASNWLVTITFLTLVQFVGPSGTFLIYFIIGIITILFVYNWIPETKGVSLEKIEANLYAGKPSRYLGKD
jgi:sugar porter (SP) family MFS transporter